MVLPHHEEKWALRLLFWILHFPTSSAPLTPFSLLMYSSGKEAWFLQNSEIKFLFLLQQMITIKEAYHLTVLQMRPIWCVSHWDAVKKPAGLPSCLEAYRTASIFFAFSSFWTLLASFTSWSLFSFVFKGRNERWSFPHGHCSDPGSSHSLFYFEGIL